MPRDRVDLPYHVVYLSILDEEGHVEQALEPDIPDELLLKLHRAMLLGRRFDERLLSLQRQGRIGTFAPITGQEASQLGAVAPLMPGDCMAPLFRIWISAFTLTRRFQRPLEKPLKFFSAA